MAYSFPPDVKQLVDSRMASGKYASEDEVLRDALEALVAECDEVEAVKKAIDEWQAGDAGTPVKEAFDEIRRRHHLSSNE